LLAGVIRERKGSSQAERKVIEVEETGLPYAPIPPYWQGSLVYGLRFSVGNVLLENN
jgi:hypothetical protein